MPRPPFRGIVVPALTPFGADLAPDAERFIAFCRNLLAEGADGLAVFGTTSEANSMSAEERMELLDRLIGAGIPADKLMPGTGACSITEAARLSAHAVSRGCGGVLLLPPFYYKEPSEDGLYAFVAAVIEAVGSADLSVYLYHIPPVARVGYPVGVVERLLRDFPETIRGLKDSSGDWASISGWIKHFPDLAVFPGSEIYLLDALRLGAAGCISATGNIDAAGMKRVWAARDDAPLAEALQARTTALRKAVQAFPMIPALKRIIARRTGDAGWVTLRPPLQALDDARAAALFAAIDAVEPAAVPA